MPRRAALSLLLFSALVFCVLAAVAEVQSLGDVSFAVPEGWSYEGASGDRATIALNQSGQVSVIAVFRPLRSSGNPDADFRSAWAQDVRSMAAPEPIYEHKSMAGYPGRYGSTNTADGSHYVQLYVLVAGQSAIPVLVITSNRQAFNSLEPAILLFVEGIRLAPAQAQPPKTTITMADLTGEWRSGGDSSVNYVTSSGAYAGSSTVAHGASYTIATDGSYKSQFAGISNRNIVRGTTAGTVELGQGMLGFRERPSNRLTRYHLVSCQTAVNGATVLTLLGDQYEMSAANIGFYGEKWIRDPPQK